MPLRESVATGTPCWVDLSTSDVEMARDFYPGLLGWEAQEANPQFGGYFNFTLDGEPVAGAMGPMGDAGADDSWKTYLATRDVRAATGGAAAAGGEVVAPVAEVGELGAQAVLTDPGGARVGAWQAREFPGFRVTGEHGAPSWFQLEAREYDRAVEFYRTVFGSPMRALGDAGATRFTTIFDPGDDSELAGIIDASSTPGWDGKARWWVYWHVDDIDIALSSAQLLGGSVESDPVESSLGIVATVADPCGAEMRLRAAG